MNERNTVLNSRSQIRHIKDLNNKNIDSEDIQNNKFYKYDFD